MLHDMLILLSPELSAIDFENKKIISLEGHLLRLALTNNISREEFIKFYIGNIDAKQILSRGEQKLFSILWCCSQHKVLKNTHNLDPTLIIDDIKSELDNNLMSVFIEALNYIENQVIFSCIDDCFSSKIIASLNEFKKFHVEQLG